METVFVCSACQVTLTHPVVLLADPTLESKEIGTARVPRGAYLLEEWGGPRLDWYVLNLEDAVHTKHHSDNDRFTGCCGPQGLDENNTVCINGHEVGSECSDCITTQFLWLDPKFVTLKIT